jgi:hypothetical protein
LAAGSVNGQPEKAMAVGRNWIVGVLFAAGIVGAAAAAFSLPSVYAVASALNPNYWIKDSRLTDILVAFYVGVIIAGTAAALLLTILSLVHAFSLALAAFRTERLAATARRFDPATLRESYALAFRHSRSLRRLAAIYLSTVRPSDESTMPNETWLVATKPAAAVFSAHEMVVGAAGYTGLRSLPKVIVAIGATLLLFDIGVAALQLQSGLSPGGRLDLPQALGGLAMGIGFLLTCVLLAAAYMPIKWCAVDLCWHYLGRLNAATDALFAAPLDIATRQTELRVEARLPERHLAVVAQLDQHLEREQRLRSEALAELQRISDAFASQSRQQIRHIEQLADLTLNAVERARLLEASYDRLAEAEKPSAVDDLRLSVQRLDQLLSRTLGEFADLRQQLRTAAGGFEAIRASNEVAQRLASSSDAVRDSIGRLSSIVDGLSEIATALASRAESGPVPVAQLPAAPVEERDLMRDLRDLMRDVEAANLAPDEPGRRNR